MPPPRRSDKAKNPFVVIGNAIITILLVVMLGTGMPTLAPIAHTPVHRGAPVLSCMFCLIWAGVLLASGAKPSAVSLNEWLSGDWWRQRLTH